MTIINDVEFSAKSALEAWQTDIQELDSGEGITSLDYLVDRAFVEQLNKDDSVLARYEFFNMFPKNIGAIDLSLRDSRCIGGHSHVEFHILTGKESSNLVNNTLNRGYKYYYGNFWV